MVIMDRVINTILGRVTRHPVGMHCPSWDDAFVSSLSRVMSSTDPPNSSVLCSDTQYNGTGNSLFFTDFRFRAWTVAPRGGK